MARTIPIKSKNESMNEYRNRLIHFYNRINKLPILIKNDIMINEGSLNVPERQLWKFLKQNFKNPIKNVGTIPKEQYFFHDDYPRIAVYYQTIKGDYHHRLMITKTISGLSLPFSTQMSPDELLAILKNIN